MALALPQGLVSEIAPIKLRMVKVTAIAEAGLWREEASIPEDEAEEFPVPPMPGFKNTQVFGLAVRGNSAGKYFPNGSVAFYVGTEQRTPAHGTAVVVRTKRNNLYETTLREFRIEAGGKVALASMAQGPKVPPPLYPNGSRGTVEIIGVVIGKFEPM